MQQADWLLATTDRDRVASALLVVLRRAERELGLQLAAGGMERHDGVEFYVWVDYDPAVDVNEAACVQVGYASDASVLQVRAGDDHVFAALVDIRAAEVAAVGVDWQRL